jgi:hypothetical protein
MPLGRCGAQVASRQSLILRNDNFSIAMISISNKSKNRTNQNGYDEKPQRGFGNSGTFEADGSTH